VAPHEKNQISNGPVYIMKVYKMQVLCPVLKILIGTAQQSESKVIMSLKTSLLAILAASSVGAIPSPRQAWSDVLERRSKVTRTEQNNGTCPVPEPISTTAKVPTPFKSLSSEDLQEVVSWLYDPAQSLNLTDLESPELAITDNYIWHIEALKPNKTDVLAYLDEGKPLAQYARVVINEGGKQDPGVTEYFVSLLAESRIVFVKSNSRAGRAAAHQPRYNYSAARLLL
jgi:hypothetical protein